MVLSGACQLFIFAQSIVIPSVIAKKYINPFFFQFLYRLQVSLSTPVKIKSFFDHSVKSSTTKRTRTINLAVIHDVAGNGLSYVLYDFRTDSCTKLPDNYQNSLIGMMWKNGKENTI